jgi:hypothetical protein
MGHTAVSTQLGLMGRIACVDIRADLPKIACPILVITTEQSGLGTVEETPGLAALDSQFGAAGSAGGFVPRGRGDA